MSSSLISPLQYTGASGSPSLSPTPAKTATPAGGIVANESTFLTLLVAQLKNQDPLTPTDSTQFVGELAQFSSLEQLTNINTNVGTLVTDVTPAATSTSTSGGSTQKSSS
jgi:flagellar basal-body rod modification protein FlgD